MKPARSILVIEDNEDDVFFIRRALKSSGLEAGVEVVNDGQAALDFLGRVGASADAARPCLMLLDLNLPFKSGLEVLEWTRQHPVWRTIIVIVLTSSTSEADMDQAYALGANSYVIKPSDATKLVDFGRMVHSYWFGWNEIPPVCRSVDAHPA